jgi:DNA-binding HxlR family transcriptional regulator
MSHQRSVVEAEMRPTNAEARVEHILMDKRLDNLKSLLEKDHAIECILLLYLDKGRWKHTQHFIREKLGRTISDGTFRARMMEIEDYGLAESVAIDPLKKYYVKTELGEKMAELLLAFFDKAESEIRAHTGVSQLP